MYPKHVTFRGLQASSPLKKRNATKTRTLANVSTLRNRKQELLKRVHDLLHPPSQNTTLDASKVSDSETVLEAFPTAGEPAEPAVGQPPFADDDGQSDWVDVDERPQPPKKKRRILPDNDTITLFQRWKSILPSLHGPFLRYTSQYTGRAVPKPPSTLSTPCQLLDCAQKTTKVVCLHLDHFVECIVISCSCTSIPQILVEHGFFPTAPMSPRLAISIPLLDLCQALFERSCEAINAFASALHSYYERRGFPSVNKHGQGICDPFRRGLGYAIQWYDCLQVQIENLIETALDECGEKVDEYWASKSAPDTCSNDSGSLVQTVDSSQTTNTAPQTLKTPPATPAPAMRTSETDARPTVDNSPPTVPPGHTDSSQHPGSTKPSRCHRILQELCPACFGGTQFGRSFQEGGDIHVSTDGNFHHRHLRSAGDGPAFYDPKHFVPKEFVDAVGIRIATARDKPKKKYTPNVPDEAINACENSYHAAKGDQQQDAEQFDDRGVMSLICRHDIPLFFANIDTPGEQQKYAVALLLWLFTMLPPDATVVGLYDIGCVLDRSLHIYDILDESIVSRLQLATTAMHAYGHQWSCQLEYNPRLRKGLGLTDGEGVERIWSCLRGLIGIERRSGRARRIWLIDRQLRFIASAYRDELGDWIFRKYEKGVLRQSKQAEDLVKSSGLSKQVLREQWKLQKAAQMSVRSHAPTRLKKELDQVLELQTEIDSIVATIQKTKMTLKNSPDARKVLNRLSALEDVHKELVNHVEELYVSLNVPKEFPELKDIPLPFLQTLLCARDLKINVRKRAIGSFWEWDRLDRAIGGHHQPLGTKLHQSTRKAIAKRKPAVLNAIKKYNGYCNTLANLAGPECPIPIPKPLPLDLKTLRDDSDLMEDVWLTPSIPQEPPRWLTDSKVREGIRGMLKAERCLEERRRLGREADNLCRWFGRKLSSIQLALQTPKFQHLAVRLQQQLEHLLYLRHRWTNPFVSQQRFDCHVNTAQEIASTLTGLNLTLQLRWTQPYVVPQLDNDEPLDDTPDAVDGVVVADLLDHELRDEVNIADPQDNGGGVIESRIRADQEEFVIPSDTLSDEEPHIHGTEYDPTVTHKLSPDPPHSREPLGTDLADILPAGVLTTHDGPHIPSMDQAEAPFTISHGHVMVDLYWTEPKLMRVDLALKGILQDYTASLGAVDGPLDAQRTFAGCKERGLVRSYFDNDDLDRLRKPGEWLNDNIINGLAAVLQNQFWSPSASQCAIFSTYLMTHIEDGGGLDDTIWRSSRASRYWERTTWIIPIHRKSAKHWVVAILHLQDATIHLFDSFASKVPWQMDLQRILSLLDILTRNAIQRGHSLQLPARWRAHVLTASRLQFNDVDCGAWILIVILSVLRGYHIVGNVEEVDMVSIRVSMLRTLYSLGYE